MSNPAVSTTTVKLNTGTIITLECPSADGLDYYYTNNKGRTLTYKRFCDTNFPNGDIGLVVTKTIRSMPECIAECENTIDCVGAIWNNKGECWLKSFIGRKITEIGFGTESAIRQR